jgi:uncharacterized SAM-binding protein YcdF (DUF218 family)
LRQEQPSHSFLLPAQMHVARQRSGFFRWLLWLSGAAATVVMCLLLWGNSLLVASDQLPPHADAAAVLQGSISAEKTRITGAVNLLQRGISDRILLSIPKESYWGQSIPPIARSYVDRNYGIDVAAKMDFCETAPGIDSTEQEAQAICACIQQHGWLSIVAVTSDYHTRRAGIVWRRTIKNQFPRIRIWIDGVPDPDFQKPWWRSRRSAKIWLLECLKLAWTVPGG